MKRLIKAPPLLQGSLSPPGDKSISHRAALLNAIIPGRATVRNFGPGDDCAATLRCLRALGTQITSTDDGNCLTIVGGTLRETSEILDAGNSGTTIRLLAGILAGQSFFSVITGDRSLRTRPMDRIILPLQAMGANIKGRVHNTRAPITIQGRSLSGIEYTLPTASAQVKSAILLAGLFAKGETLVHEPLPTRDHTERMLKAMGATIGINDRTIRLRSNATSLTPLDMTIPGDISSASYWLVAALCHPNARILLKGVGQNPTRTGILEVLNLMGGHIVQTDAGVQGNEPLATLAAETSTLHGIEVAGEMIPRLIDEIPLLALAACFAQGTTVIRDALELRLKESDRLRTTALELSRLGADVTELPDGLVIRGTGRLYGADCSSHGDHRLAMTLGIAGLLANGETTISGADSASVSYPRFWNDLDSLALHPTEEQ
jgi:3-phosphoshikimate 1-carboxyvinyltransferase